MPIEHDYVCDSCKRKLTDIRDEDDLMNEYNTLFTEEQRDGAMARVCHTCWIALMKAAEKEGLIGPEWRQFAEAAD